MGVKVQKLIWKHLRFSVKFVLFTIKTNFRLSCLPRKLKTKINLYFSNWSLPVTRGCKQVNIFFCFLSLLIFLSFFRRIDLFKKPRGSLSPRFSTFYDFFSLLLTTSEIAEFTKHHNFGLYKKKVLSFLRNNHNQLNSNKIFLIPTLAAWHLRLLDRLRKKPYL